MIESDYIMRMIGALTNVLARVLFLKRAKEYPEALIEIDTAGKSLLGVDREIIRSFSPEQLMEFLGSDPSLALPKAYVLGVLLHEEAEILNASGNADGAASLSKKSLELLVDAFLRSDDSIDPEHRHRIDGALAALRRISFSPGLLQMVCSYHERSGRYDKAEDVLFELLDIDSTYRNSGIAFYERILRLTDAELIRGNLPRAEAEESLRLVQCRTPTIPEAS